MITEAVVSVVFGLLGAILYALPDDDVDWPIVNQFPEWFGERIGPFNALMPISESTEVLELMVDVFGPIIIGIRLSMWLWFMLPVIK